MLSSLTPPSLGTVEFAVHDPAPSTVEPELRLDGVFKFTPVIALDFPPPGPTEDTTSTADEPDLLAAAPEDEEVDSEAKLTPVQTDNKSNPEPPKTSNSKTDVSIQEPPGPGVHGGAPLPT